MSEHEKRAAQRYVIDGLFVDFNGIEHEAVDVSSRAFALVRRAGVDYSSAKRSGWFMSTNVAALTRPITEITRVSERGSVVIFDYSMREPQIEPMVWEDALRRHDASSETVSLNDSKIASHGAARR
jgi:hypothetical protein